ncbi:hypothetical protein LCGC14_1117360 [marine sediment metagenome]|uniref:Uncharacterized protein n=1 Tax=marine sediment metagenome TaxID=412755 RepID=A0A0F9M9R6_9ZZZZ
MFTERQRIRVAELFRGQIEYEQRMNRPNVVARISALEDFTITFATCFGMDCPGLNTEQFYKNCGVKP